MFGCRLWKGAAPPYICAMPIDPASICVLANPNSGRGAGGGARLDAAMATFGPSVPLRRLSGGQGFESLAKQAIADGYTTLVAAGGDGTVNALAHALMGSDVNLAILPLGTFNFVSRGLGLPEDPEAAARAILAGHPHRISVGSVNGQVFLNNASIGIYPRLLQQREALYARWGRSRLLAYWTVLSTILRVQAPRRLVIDADGTRHDLTSPLVFVARSAYQLEQFGLSGADLISDDHFAVFVALGGSRWHLIKLAFHLARRRLEPGTDVMLFATRDMDIQTGHRRPRIAYDGEKRRMRAPLRFRIHHHALSIIIPDAQDKVKP